MKTYKHFSRQSGKYIDDNGTEVTLDMLMASPHYINNDDGFIVVPDETAPLKSEISRLKQRLADCERKRLTGDRI